MVRDYLDKGNIGFMLVTCRVGWRASFSLFSVFDRTTEQSARFT